MIKTETQKAIVCCHRGTYREWKDKVPCEGMLLYLTDKDVLCVGDGKNTIDKLFRHQKNISSSVYDKFVIGSKNYGTYDHPYNNVASLIDGIIPYMDNEVYCKSSIEDLLLNSESLLFKNTFNLQIYGSDHANPPWITSSEFGGNVRYTLDTVEVDFGDEEDECVVTSPYPLFADECLLGFRCKANVVVNQSKITVQSANYAKFIVDNHKITNSAIWYVCESDDLVLPDDERWIVLDDYPTLGFVNMSSEKAMDRFFYLHIDAANRRKDVSEYYTEYKEKFNKQISQKYNEPVEDFFTLK